MGLLDRFLGGVSPDLSKLVTGNPGAMQAVLALLSPTDTSVGGSGGLGGLVKLFESKGLGSMINSWIGTGPNPAISAGQVENVLGSDVLGQFAQKAGIAPSEAGGVLASVLPTVVDHLTPNGQMPSQGGLEQSIGSLLGMFSRSDTTT